MISQNFDVIEQYISPLKKRDGGISILHELAGRCRACGEHLCRLHYNRFSFSHGKAETWYYCDCVCGQGTVTGWYSTKEEAIDAWNRGIEINKKTEKVEGRIVPLKVTAGKNIRNEL